MTDRDPDDDEAADWLAAQFDPTGELPKQPGQPVPPAQPAPPASPTPPAPAQPVQAPPARAPLPPQPPLQPQQPLAPQAPLQPQMPPAPPAPVQPQVPVAPQVPVQPPAQQPPAQPVSPQFPPRQPAAPAAPAAPATPVPPVQPAPPVPPTQPAQPTQPFPPAQPVRPAQPLQPPQPAPPAQPAQPFPPAAQPFPPSAPPVPPATPVPPAAQPFPPAAPVPPTVPPVPPATPAPERQAPAQPSAAAPPATPPASPATSDPAGRFSWGLSPGGSSQPAAPVTPPAAALPAASPPPAMPAPAAPSPATPPPAAPPPATPPATPVPVAPPPPFYRPVAHEPEPLDPALEGVPSVAAHPPASAMPFETTVLPDVAPDSADAPAFWEPEPTQMMDAVDLVRDPPARVPQPVPTSVFPPQTRATEALPAGADPAGGAGDQVSAMDSLFGEGQFREYTEGLDPSQNPFVRQAEQASGRSPLDPADAVVPPGPHPGISRVQRTLLWVLGGLLAVLAIVALFFLGARLPDLLGPAPAVATPTSSPSPSASPGIALGPVAPGEYAWDELLGGECLDPYVSPWETTYTVVDCADPHPAQMVHHGEVPEPTAGTDTTTDPDTQTDGGFSLYPGEDVLQTQVLEYCRGPGIFDPAQVAAVPDVVVQASFPTEEVWNEGGRDYYCFVTRSTGEPLTVDVALPQVAPVPPA